MRPQSLNVLGQLVDIRTAHAHQHTLGDPVLAGRYRSNDNSIHVDADAPTGVQQNTVLHETIHALLYLMGYEDDKHDREAMVMALGTGLLQVMRANPDLVAWLVE